MEEQKVPLELTHQAQMAGPRTCRNPCLTGKDELAEEAFTESNGTLTPIPAVSHVPTSMLAQALALAQTPALGLPGLYIDMNI